uniref:NADH dehydrogenase subunit 6 n=1 Tax=Epipenaeon fissurae TaxID=2995643 RepID=UPI0022FD9035|nr:NADH dehydrogenase subunit 6 [Epipenaeon fissurae]WBK03030.1 NADH dehydrogenase subunit 6 [Epipenaeon fissurae]
MSFSVLLLSFSVILVCTSSTPGALILSLLVQSAFVVYTIMEEGVLTWMGYILVLIFWGSMMILFLYCVCLMPNPEKSGMSSLMLLSTLLFGGLVMLLSSVFSLSSDYLVCSVSVETLVSLGERLTTPKLVILFIYSLNNLLLILLVVCKMSEEKFGGLSIVLK